MSKLYIFIIVVLIGTTIYYSNKTIDTSLKNERYENDIRVLQKEINVSDSLITLYEIRDSLKTLAIDSLNVKYNNAVKDEEIKKKYDNFFEDIGNADWDELDSILTKYGILE